LYEPFGEMRPWVVGQIHLGLSMMRRRWAGLEPVFS
jgi:hypothetical protein